MNRDAEKKFIHFLKIKRLKYTPQRRTILEEAFRSKSHFTADDFLDSSRHKKQGISKATLYRTLSLLTESGILEEQDFGRGRKSYERRLGHPHHDHLICMKCNRIFEFENQAIERLQAQEALRRRFKILFHSHKLFGYCDKCQTHVTSERIV